MRAKRQKGWWLFFVLALLFSFTERWPETAIAYDNDLAALNRAILSRGGRWIAGETSMSNLPAHERHYSLGALRPKISDEAIEAGTESLLSAMTMDIPPSLDWRSLNGSNFVTPVRNQGKCGSCWAFATTAALESQALIDLKTPGTGLDLSEQILVSSCSTAGTCQGGYVDEASTFIRDTGLPLEACFPYSAETNTCSLACSNWQSSTYGITSWLWITGSSNVTVEAVKNGLFMYGPLVTTMDVYADFYAYSGGIYSYTGGDYVGGHAVLIVGYNDDQRYFLVKNSWGTGWGESGFFRIDYSQVSDKIGFGSYTIAYDSYQPLPRGCLFAISPSEKSFRSFGGRGTISVSTKQNCSWTAASTVPWITIFSGTKGTGKGKIVYTVGWNRTGVPRTGTILAAGKTFTVTQSK